jgi:hypothetical protein
MLYFILEIKHIVTDKTLNIPKNLVLIGTATSWYFAIVYFNSDLVFTLINVVSHGVPYMALIWMYGAKKLQMPQLSGLQKLVFSTKGLLFFVLLLLLFAFVEETLWDSLIWHDYPQYFNFTGLWGTWLSPVSKALLVSMLTVPQVTHYLLDGFIWKQQKH